MVKGLVVRQLVAVAGVGVLVAAVVGVAGREGWWLAFGVALAAVVGSVLAAVPLLLVAFANPKTVAGGVMGSMLVRMVALGGLAAVGVVAFGAPAAATLLMVIPMYLAALAGEVIFASGALWKP
jgi:hypothetical protein